MKNGCSQADSGICQGLGPCEYPRGASEGTVSQELNTKKSCLSRGEARIALFRAAKREPAKSSEMQSKETRKIA